MLRIVVTESMDEGGLACLRSAHEVVYDPALVDDPVHLNELAGTADALVVRNRTQVRGELLGALVRCRVVGRLGVGLDNIDVAACEARRVQVVSATGANALSVAEYVIATSMILLRGAYLSSASVASGAWPRTALSAGREVAGKTMGVVGFGSIGQRTAALARAVGMVVIAHDAALPAGDPAFARAGARAAGLDALLAHADIVTLHVLLLESTRNLFDATRIARLRRGAILVNTARGEVVDERAVAMALRSGHLGGAALDVFAREPLPAGSPLVDCPNLLLTPHIAGLTAESGERVGSVVAQGVLRALAAHV